MPLVNQWCKAGKYITEIPAAYELSEQQFPMKFGHGFAPRNTLLIVKHTAISYAQWGKKTTV